MSKLVDINGLKIITQKITQDIKTHTHTNYITQAILDDYTGGKKQRYLTQAEYDILTNEQKNDDSIVYNITDIDNTYNDTELSNRVSALEAIDHSQFLTGHQDLSEYAKKTEVPAQPNFTYQINMIASDQQPSVTTTGTYPDLIITFNIPQGIGGSTGGNDGPVDTGTPRMWYGWIPYDETGAAGFSTPEEIGTGMTKTVIQFGLDKGTLIETDPQGFNSKKELGTVDENAFVCCIVPTASNIVSYLDNSGAKLSYSTLNPEDYPCSAEGLEITNPIDGVYYKIYGFMTILGALRAIWIEEK